MEASEIEIVEKVPASRKLQADDAAELLGSAKKLIAMKGKKVVEFDLKTVTDEMIKAILGPTGNMRAPTLRKGKTILVGFNEEVYSAEFG